MVDNGLHILIEEKVKRGKKLFSVLIDPDKQNFAELLKTVELCNTSKIDFFLVGGSILTNGDLDKTVHAIKENSNIPVILFPGSHSHITNKADGILFLSLISGNNPDYLIGNQILATSSIRKTTLEVIPTGYILVDCGKTTTVVKVSKTEPITYNDYKLADTTAFTGQLLGKKLIYIDGGSGAEKAISEEMIKQVKNSLNIPLIIGGGIRSSSIAEKVYGAGADVIVVGNGAEENRNLIAEISTLKAKLNS